MHSMLDNKTAVIERAAITPAHKHETNVYRCLVQYMYSFNRNIHSTTYIFLLNTYVGISVPTNRRYVHSQ